MKGTETIFLTIIVIGLVTGRQQKLNGIVHPEVEDRVRPTLIQAVTDFES